MTRPDDLDDGVDELDELETDETDEPDETGMPSGPTDKGFKVGAGLGVLGAVLAVALMRAGDGRIVQPTLGIAALGGLVAGLLLVSSPGTRRTGTIILTAVAVMLVATMAIVYALLVLSLTGT